MTETAGIQFILKYGFIILILIVLIFLLNYLNVFDVFLAPENCHIDEGFECISFAAHKDGINLMLQNLHDFDVSIAQIKFRNCVFQGRTYMQRGISRPFLLKNCILNGKMKDNLRIDYFSPDNVLHRVNGSLVVSIR